MMDKTNVGGRPRADQQKVQQAISLYRTQQYTVSEIQDMTGIARSTLYRAMKQQDRADDIS